MSNLIYILSTSGVVGGVIDSTIGEGGQITLEEMEVLQMWEKITTGVGSFITGVVTPVGEFCVNSEICLMFLTVTFVSLGVRMLRKSIGAFGRGR